jgi:hypothetical protein
MDTRSNQSNPFTGFTSRKGERPNTPGYDAQPQSAPLNMSAFQRQQGVQTPFGSMPNLQAYQNQQDAFVQQFLQNQAQYNQGVMGGQRPEPVDLGATWGQAANNIRDGLYQGNPFATGNVNALMGMFGQYGITPPQGFQDQLLAQLGQQSAPPMYAPQPAFDVPRPINPGTGLPYGQPLTDLPYGPNGEYWPAFRSPPPPAASPSGLRKDVVPNPAGGDRVRDSHVAVFPGGRPINFPPGWQIRNIGDVGGNQSREIYAPGVSDEEVAQFIRDNGGQGGPNQVVGRLGGNLAERGQPGPGLPPPGSAQPTPPSQQLPPGRMADWGFPGYTQPGGPQYPVGGMQRPGAAQPIPPGQQVPAQDDQEFRQYIANASPEDRANFANSWRHLTEGYANDAAKAARERSIMQMMAQDMRGGASYLDAFNRTIERLGPEPMRKIPSYETVGPKGPRAYSDAELRSLFDQKKLAERAAPIDQPSTLEFLRSQGLIELDAEGGVREKFTPGRASPIPTRTSGTQRGTPKTEDDDTPKPLRASPGSSGPGWRESGGFRIYDGYTDPRGTGVIGSDTTRPGERRDPVTGQRLYDPYTDPVATGGARTGGAYRSPSGNNTWGPPTRRNR